MAEIKIENLTFGYEGSSENIFDNISFSFDSAWKIGLIGRNGRGKTTLLKLLLGELEFKGKIFSPINFSYFPYQISNKDLLVNNILLQDFGDCELWKIIKNLKELDLDESIIYQMFSTLSNGEQTKLLLAILFSKENNFLLIDEPTNHLDFNARESVQKFLNNQRGFIVVSHDRAFIDNCVDHIISINRNDISIQKGDFSSWWENKCNQDNFELMRNAKLRKDISRLEESIKRTQKWSDQVEKTKNGTRISGLKPDKGAIGHQAAKMAKRGKAIEARQSKMIDEKSKLLKNIEKQDELFLNNKDFKGDNLITIQNLSLSYGEKEVLKNINLNVYSQDKIAICGKNGCGKTSLLKAILSEDIKFTGNIIRKQNLKISYISQKYDWLSGNLIEFARDNKIDQTKFFTMLIKLGFDRGQFEKPITNFSAGQKKKVLIAKSLCEEANLYIWDESLNYIDVISRIQIEELIKSSNITLIFVEHDAAFVKNIATKIIYI